MLPGVDAPENALQFLLLNANKRGVTLDLDRSGARDLFLRLVGSADVLIDSLSAKRRAALGVTEAATAAAHPKRVPTPGARGPPPDPAHYPTASGPMPTSSRSARIV